MSISNDEDSPTNKNINTKSQLIIIDKDTE